MVLVVVIHSLITEFWESAEHFKHAINGPEYRSRVAEPLPNTTMHPHLVQESRIYAEEIIVCKQESSQLV